MNQGDFVHSSSFTLHPSSFRGEAMLVGKDLGPFHDREGTGQRGDGVGLPGRQHARPASTSPSRSSRSACSATRRPSPASSARPTSSSSSSTRNIVRLYRHRQATSKTPFYRDGVRRGRVARPHPGTPRPAGLGGSGRPRPAALRRPAARPRQGHHPPRPQAVQPDGPARTARSSSPTSASPRTST